MIRFSIKFLSLSFFPASFARGLPGWQRPERRGQRLEYFVAFGDYLRELFPARFACGLPGFRIGVRNDGVGGFWGLEGSTRNSGDSIWNIFLRSKKDTPSSTSFQLTSLQWMVVSGWWLVAIRLSLWVWGQVGSWLLSPELITWNMSQNLSCQ